MERITINSQVMHGKPIIRGTRVPVEVVLGGLIGGMTYEELEGEYGIEKEDILAAIAYATKFIIGEEVRTFKTKT